MIKSNDIYPNSGGYLIFNHELDFRRFNKESLSPKHSCKQVGLCMLFQVPLFLPLFYQKKDVFILNTPVQYPGVP